MSKLKLLVQRVLQLLLGYRLYLFVFSNFKIQTLKLDQNEKDFFHFLDILPADGHLLDVGANIGIMTFYMSRFTSGQVLSVEPEPTNLKVLKSICTFHRLNNVEVVGHAVGAENGALKMILPVVGKVRKQGLSHVKDEQITSFNEGNEFEVEVLKIDELPFVTKHTIAGIKLDVENYEYRALLGARALIQRDRPIVYTELWDNQNRRDCFDLMRSMGYDVKVWNGTALCAFEADQHHTQNFFFMPS